MLKAEFPSGRRKTELTCYKVVRILGDRMVSASAFGPSCLGYKIGEKTLPLKGSGIFAFLNEDDVISFINQCQPSAEMAILRGVGEWHKAANPENIWVPKGTVELEWFKPLEIVYSLPRIWGRRLLNCIFIIASVTILFLCMYTYKRDRGYAAILADMEEREARASREIPPPSTTYNPYADAYTARCKETEQAYAKSARKELKYQVWRDKQPIPLLDGDKGIILFVFVLFAWLVLSSLLQVLPKKAPDFSRGMNWDRPQRN